MSGKIGQAHYTLTTMATVRTLYPQYPFSPLVRSHDKREPYPSPLLAQIDQIQADISRGLLCWNGCTGRKAANQFKSHVQKIINRHKYCWQWTLEFWYDPSGTLEKISSVLGLDRLTERC